MKALVGAFNQEKALVGAFSVIVKNGCGTDGSFYSTKIHGMMRASEDHQIVPAVVGLVCGVSIVSQCEAKLRVVDGWVVHSVQMQCSGDNTVTVTHSPTLHRAWLGS